MCIYYFSIRGCLAGYMVYYNRYMIYKGNDNYTYLKGGGAG